MSRFAEARFRLGAASVSQYPPDRGREVAFAGRSNAGKSSAINAILARRGLARTGKTPGQTRLINFFDLGPERRIVDLPGYGYARAPREARIAWGPLLDALRERHSLRGVFLVVDARRGLGEADRMLIDWALGDRSDPAARAVHVLLTKADKLTRSEAAEALSEARKSLGGRSSVQLFSASSREGLGAAQAMLESWLDHKKTPGASGEATGAD
jgi:GTP-binding protein